MTLFHYIHILVMLVGALQASSPKEMKNLKHRIEVKEI